MTRWLAYALRVLLLTLAWSLLVEALRALVWNLTADSDR